MKPINEENINEALRLCSFGLVKGLGTGEPGDMCIEHIICQVFEGRKGDNPSCVSNEFNKAKISLNECNWSSNKARAEGMKYLLVAQIGSNALDDKIVREHLRFLSAKKILPYIIQKHYDSLFTKDEKLLVYKSRFESLTKLDDKLWKEFYNNYYNSYYYNNYYYNYYYKGDEFLLLIADTILQCMKDLNSPGCQYLYLVK